MPLPVLAVGPILKAIGSAAKSVPWRAWLALGAFLALALAFYLYGEHREARGEAKVEKEWAESIARGKRRLDELKAKQSKVTVKVETRYLDRVKVIREKGQTIVREVKVFVPADSCELPGGFRLLHDAAASNTLPDPAGIPDAAAVPAQAAAATVADNYAACHESAERLTSLQDWVRRQQELTQ